MVTRALTALACAAVVGFAAPGASPAAPVMTSTCGSPERTLASVARASGPLLFHDSTGETRGPDICAENLVTNDNEGLITFAMHITNRDGFAPTEAYGVFLDVDANTATGPGGADWRVRIGADGAAVLSQWNGVDAFVATDVELLEAAWAPDYGPVFWLDAADVGNPQRFSFVFFATDGTNVDGAPNQGAWDYELAPLRLTVGSLKLDRARAGRTFNARLAVNRSDFDLPLDEGEVTCTAKIGARSISGRGRFAGDRVVCAFQIPKGTRGKRITGTVSVTFQGVVASRGFVAKIR